jgi:hypothetical protein
MVAILYGCKIALRNLVSSLAPDLGPAMQAIVSKPDNNCMNSDGKYQAAKINPLQINSLINWYKIGMEKYQIPP